jgi:hypothetical protein
LFQLVSAYSLSHNTIESAETSRLFHQPNQPNLDHVDGVRLEVEERRKDRMVLVDALLMYMNL